MAKKRIVKKRVRNKGLELLPQAQLLPDANAAIAACEERPLHGLKADSSARADDQDCRHGADTPGRTRPLNVPLLGEVPQALNLPKDAHDGDCYIRWSRPAQTSPSE